jgi:hypothetical protein
VGCAAAPGDADIYRDQHDGHDDAAEERDDFESTTVRKSTRGKAEATERDSLDARS